MRLNLEKSLLLRGVSGMELIEALHLFGVGCN